MFKLKTFKAVSLVLAVVLTTLSCSAVSAQDYNKGLAAAQSGDYATALQELRPLAEQGHASAQHHLGTMYANGYGVTQDYVYAHMWYNIAASLGSANASKNRNKEANAMTAADISKAQGLARECVRNNYKGC